MQHDDQIVSGVLRPNRCIVWFYSNNSNKNAHLVWPFFWIHKCSKVSSLICLLRIRKWGTKHPQVVIRKLVALPDLLAQGPKSGAHNEQPCGQTPATNHEKNRWNHLKKWKNMRNNSWKVGTHPPTRLCLFRCRHSVKAKSDSMLRSWNSSKKMQPMPGGKGSQKCGC